MIEEPGRVMSVEQDGVWVETIRKSTCSSCSARNGCGQHLAERYVSSKSHSYIRATSDVALNENDKVVVGIPEGALIKASMFVYLLPLVSMMGSLWLSTWLEWNELVTVLTALAGLALGFLPVRSLGRRAGEMCRVRVVRVLPREVTEPEWMPVRKSWSA
ncbi:MAG: SoxR reducing system RseC family protein [Endozoicomonas sp.]